MILVFCSPGDLVAQAVYEHLQSQGADVCLVTATDLVFATYWRHDLSAEGVVDTEIKLPGGKLVRSNEVQAAYNRLNYLEALHFLNDTDRAYAEMEFGALYMSFLKSIEHALPAPLQLWQLSPEGLSELEWQAAAIAAGLRVTDTHFTSSPKWALYPDMTPMSPLRASRELFYRKSPNLIWEDRPLRQCATTDTIKRVSIAGWKVLTPVSHLLERPLVRLARSLGTVHIDALIADAEGDRPRLHGLETMSLSAAPEVIAAISDVLLQKTLQAV